jgi:putative oxidoreductase
MLLENSAHLQHIKNKNMNMKLLTDQIGKYLFAIPFGIFGILHLMKADEMVGLVPLPGGVFWVYVTGLALLAASISIITGKEIKLACLLLAGLLLIFVFFVHVPGLLKGGGMANSSLMNLLKDTALAGGALILADRFKDL